MIYTPQVTNFTDTSVAANRTNTVSINPAKRLHLVNWYVIRTNTTTGIQTILTNDSANITLSAELYSYTDEAGDTHSLWVPFDGNPYSLSGVTGITQSAFHTSRIQCVLSAPLTELAGHTTLLRLEVHSRGE